MIREIILTGAGVQTSNGVYERVSNEKFICTENQNRIALGVDGWTLTDSTSDDQTYMFDKEFTTVFAVGDCIEPVPNYELVY